ncbi:uncharacterized protein LOC143696440 isoform X6 [Agelaius phoeniceus]|uniref:uncharacterized protein LOC143696440 isoform X6 n=1 Tax=Agelaius phoeniceus TaxID=39638 RepID=UPI0040552CCD
MSWGCPALLALSPGALLTWILGSAHLLGTEPQSLHSAHLDPADCGICSPGPCRLWHLLTCLGLCPKTCILLTWTLQTVGSAHLDPADCGICSPGPCRLWHLLTWTCSPEHSLDLLMLLDLLTWICSPEHALDLLTLWDLCPWTRSPGPCRLWDLLPCLGLCPKTCILLTWTPQTVGSAHLDPADCGICSPEHALDLLTLWDLCLWTCSCCWTCSPGPAHLALLTLWDLCPWTCSPGPCRLWDLLTWICSPEHSQDLLTWTCSPGSAHLVRSVPLDLLSLWDLFTWTLQTVGSAHLSTPWICSHGPAHLSIPRICSPCGTCSPGPCRLWDLCPWICSAEHSQDLLTWTCSPCGTCVPGPAHLVGPVPSGPAHLDAPRPRGHRDPNPPIQLLPPSRCFPEFLISPLAFPADFPHWALTLTLLLLGATCAP